MGGTGGASVEMADVTAVINMSAFIATLGLHVLCIYCNRGTSLLVV